MFCFVILGWKCLEITLITSCHGASRFAIVACRVLIANDEKYVDHVQLVSLVNAANLTVDLIEFL